MDCEYEPLIEGVSTLEQPIPILQLLRAFSEKKRSKLIRLCLKFDIDDEMVQVIAKIKGLRMLECGFCDPKSIRHLVQHPTLNRLSILNKGHLVTDDIADLLRKQVTVSSHDAKMLLSARGYLGICTRNNSYAEIYRSVNFEVLLKIYRSFCKPTYAKAAILTIISIEYPTKIFLIIKYFESLT